MVKVKFKMVVDFKDDETYVRVKNDIMSGKFQRELMRDSSVEACKSNMQPLDDGTYMVTNTVTFRNVNMDDVENEMSEIIKDDGNGKMKIVSFEIVK